MNWRASMGIKNNRVRKQKDNLAAMSLEEGLKAKAISSKAHSHDPQHVTQNEGMFHSWCCVLFAVFKYNWHRWSSERLLWCNWWNCGYK